MSSKSRTHRPTHPQPQSAPASEAKPQPTPMLPAPASEAKPPRQELTGLLIKCFEFQEEASEEEQELLSDMLDMYKESPCSFPRVAPSKALHELEATISVDQLDNPDFCELLNLFGRAVTGWGYGGFREQIIASLLERGKRGMKFKDALAILVQEYSEVHNNLAAARDALKGYPEELADAIAEAAARS